MCIFYYFFFYSAIRSAFSNSFFLFSFYSCLSWRIFSRCFYILAIYLPSFMSYLAFVLISWRFLCTSESSDNINDGIRKIRGYNPHPKIKVDDASEVESLVTDIRSPYLPPNRSSSKQEKEDDKSPKENSPRTPRNADNLSPTSRELKKYDTLLQYSGEKINKLY